MAADDEPTAGGTPGSVNDLIGALLGMTEKLTGLSGLAAMVPGMTSLPALPALPTMPSIPRPGALTAAQLAAMSGAIASQRRSIEAMQAQLAAFDQQLAVMEQVLEPLIQWSTTWADLEKKVMPPRSGDE